MFPQTAESYTCLRVQLMTLQFVRNCYDLDRGDVVEFEIEKTKKGLRAVNVKILHN